MNNPGLFQARWDLRGWLYAISCLWRCRLLVMAYGAEAARGFRRVALSPIRALLAINPIWLHGWAIASSTKAASQATQR